MVATPPIVAGIEIDPPQCERFPELWELPAGPHRTSLTEIVLVPHPPPRLEVGQSLDGTVGVQDHPGGGLGFAGMQSDRRTGILISSGGVLPWIRPVACGPVWSSIRLSPRSSLPPSTMCARPTIVSQRPTTPLKLYGRFGGAADETRKALTLGADENWCPLQSTSSASESLARSTAPPTRMTTPRR